MKDYEIYAALQKHSVASNDPRLVIAIQGLLNAAAPASLGEAKAVAPEGWKPDWEHVANEWADVACGALQWLRNLRDGISDAATAIDNTTDGITHAREVEREVRNASPVAQALPVAESIPVDDLLKILPSDNRYLDLPDGGSVTVLEQLQRMAKDADPYYRSAHSHAIDMVLYCPECGVQHIDAPDTPQRDFPYKEVDGKRVDIPSEINTVELWTNPPHKSHFCGSCGCIWRPADVPTNGVRKVLTRGKNDTGNGERKAVAGTVVHLADPNVAAYLDILARTAKAIGLPDGANLFLSLLPAAESMAKDATECSSLRSRLEAAEKDAIFVTIGLVQSAGGRVTVTAVDAMQIKNLTLHRQVQSIGIEFWTEPTK